MKKLIFFAFLVFFAHDMHAGKTLDPNEGDNYLLFNAQGEQEYDDSALPTILAAHKKGVLTQQEKKALETLLGVEQGKPQHDSMVGDFRSNIRKLKKETIVSAYQARQLDTSAGSHSSTPISTVATPHATATSMSTHQEGTPLATTETFVRRRLRSQPRATQDPEIYLLYSSTAQQMYDRSSLGLLKEIANGQAEGKKSIADFRYLEGKQLILKGRNTVTITTDDVQTLFDHVEQAGTNKAFIEGKISARATTRADGKASLTAAAEERNRLTVSSIVAGPTSTPTRTNLRTTRTTGLAVRTGSDVTTPSPSTALAPAVVAAPAPLAPRTSSALSQPAEDGSDRYLLYSPDGRTQVFTEKSLPGLVALRDYAPTGDRKKRADLATALNAELAKVEPVASLASHQKTTFHKSSGFDRLLFLTDFQDVRNQAMLKAYLGNVTEAQGLPTSGVSPTTSTRATSTPLPTISSFGGSTAPNPPKGMLSPSSIPVVERLTSPKSLATTQRRPLDTSADASPTTFALPDPSTPRSSATTPRSPQTVADGSGSDDSVFVANPLHAATRPRTAKSMDSYTYQHGDAAFDGLTRDQRVAASDADREARHPQKSSKQTQDVFIRSLESPLPPTPLHVDPSLRQMVPTPQDPPGTTLGGPTHDPALNREQGTGTGPIGLSSSNTSGLTGVFTQASSTPREQTPATGARAETLYPHPDSPTSPFGSFRSQDTSPTTPRGDALGSTPFGFRIGGIAGADGTQYGPDFVEDGDTDASGSRASTPLSLSRRSSQSSLGSTLQGWPAARDGMSTSLQLEEARSLLAQQRQIAGETAPLVREAQEARNEATRALAQVAAQQRAIAQAQTALEASIAAQAAAAITPEAPAVDHSGQIAEMQTQLTALQERQGELAAVRNELAAVRQGAQAAQERLRSDVLEATERGLAVVETSKGELRSKLGETTALADRALKAAHAAQEQISAVLPQIRGLEESRDRHRGRLTAIEAQQRAAADQAASILSRLDSTAATANATEQRLTRHLEEAQRAAEQAATDKAALTHQLQTLQEQMRTLTTPVGDGAATEAQLSARMVGLKVEQARLKQEVETATAAQARSAERATGMERSLTELTHAKAAQEKEIAELRKRLDSAPTREELAAVSQKVAALERESQSSRDTLRRQVAETVATIHTDQRRRDQRRVPFGSPGASRDFSQSRSPVTPPQSPREGSSLGSFAGSAGGGALISYVAPTPTQLTTPVRREKPIRFATQTHTTSNMWKKRRTAPAPVHTPAPVLTDFKDAFEQAALRLRAPVAHRPEPEVGTADADHTALTKALRPAPSAPSHTVRKASPAQTFWTTATQARTPTQRAHAYRLVPYRPH